MKKRSAMLLGTLLFTGAFAISVAASPNPPKDKDQIVGRMLTGKVLDKRDNPVVDAVVYLSNTRTRAVKTYIVGPDGTYRFPDLATNVDFEIYAQYKGQKSDTKAVSQFDDHKQINIVLRIDTK
ncbi:MAG TPA: carboxypeptidase-like regulatory domain-containing protein [Terriglobales bacterium]|nr:carboxypeptidase-like regulatory domain-containing protein [Terriglobales bacterium]